jgi:beta-aspartyl-peptidase (threonine type)
MAQGCVLAVHGGAGTIRKADISARTEARLHAALERSLRAGHAVLDAGGAALDAVVAAVAVLEDSPLFNAGRGAVYNAQGRHELDASIMDGATLRAGGVTCVRRIRNPIAAARAVMEKSAHVLLAGEGAERFARKSGVELVSPQWFDTRSRLAALKREREGRSRGDEDVHGTVGAVALDRHGNLAAATSTGGYTGKLAGRVGDSPVVGAGTYADNASCAVSGTGWGEAFIRVALAHEVSARVRHLDETLAKSARVALQAVARIGGDGGLVAIDRRGNIAMPFNSEGMFRACVRADGRRLARIYR